MKMPLKVIIVICVLFISLFFFFEFRNNESVSSISSSGKNQVLLNLENVEFSQHRDSIIEAKNEIIKDSIQEKSRSVKISKSDTVYISEYDVLGNESDETDKIQTAINKSVGKILFFPKQKGKYYLTGQLIVPSNITLLFDSNVVVLAKDDLKQSINGFEVLFRIQNVQNVKIQGNGAHFRMNTSKYSSEYNHLFMINGSRNVLIQNVNAIGSGGDGFYVGAYKTKLPSSYNVRIENSKALNNRRQGISLTSVDGFYAINCEFSNSIGARPEAGVCIEPSLSTGILNNIQFRDCIANNNNGRGFQVVLIKNKTSTDPVEIKFENCYANNNEVGFSSSYFSGESSGIITFSNCIAENNKGTGFLEGSCDANGAKKLYLNCISINNSLHTKSGSSNEKLAGFAVINLEKYKKNVLGNSVYKNCIVENSSDSSVAYGFYVEEDINISNLHVESFETKGNKKISLFKNLEGRKGVLIK